MMPLAGISAISSCIKILPVETIKFLSR